MQRCLESLVLTACLSVLLHWQAGERAVSPAGSRTPSEVRLKIEAFESLARKREAQTRAA